MPERIQLRRTKGWRMPPDTVKVDRTTKWGNPFVVGKPGGVFTAEVKDRPTAARAARPRKPLARVHFLGDGQDDAQLGGGELVGLFHIGRHLRL